jgi:hypothetical protein
MTDFEKHTTIACMYITKKPIKFISDLYNLDEESIKIILIDQEVYEYYVCNVCNNLKIRYSFLNYYHCYDCGTKINLRYSKHPVDYNLYNHKLSKYEQIRDDGQGILEAKCNYCYKYFKPTNYQIHKRLKSIYKNKKGKKRNYLHCGCQIHT